MKRRRVLLAAAGGMALGAARALAQRAGRTYRIAVLFSAGGASNAPYRQALVERLAAHGFVEGKNLQVDARYSTGGGFSGDRTVLGQLLAAQPDAILAFTATAARAALALTRSIPIVFAWVPDPEGLDFVQKYARPGGNATGVSDRFQEVAVKRLEFLRELLPSARRVALAGPLYLPELEAAASRLRESSKRLGFELLEASTGWGTQVSAVEAALERGAQALLPLAVYSAVGQRITGEQVVRLALERRVPAVFAEGEMVEAGGLMSYGTSLLEDVRRAAEILAKVLRGASPGELPIDQASRFELALNLGTAQRIGVTIPRSILLRADRVIE